MDHIDHGHDHPSEAGDQQPAWNVEDRNYALAMHIDLDWEELNILGRCACSFPNAPERRCIVCERCYGRES